MANFKESAIKYQPQNYFNITYCMNKNFSLISHGLMSNLSTSGKTTQWTHDVIIMHHHMYYVKVTWKRCFDMMALSLPVLVPYVSAGKRCHLFVSLSVRVSSWILSPFTFTMQCFRNWKMSSRDTNPSPFMSNTAKQTEKFKLRIHYWLNVPQVSQYWLDNPISRGNLVLAHYEIFLLIPMMMTSSEWVSEWLKLTAFLRTADNEVHIVHISRVIIAYTLESLSFLT